MRGRASATRAAAASAQTAPAMKIQTYWAYRGSGAPGIRLRVSMVTTKAVPRDMPTERAIEFTLLAMPVSAGVTWATSRAGRAA